MRFTPINGYSKAAIVKTILTKIRATPSFDAHVSRYHNVDGNRCVIGAFIPDDIYTSRMEATNVQTLPRLFPEVCDHFPLPLRALRKLQWIHDTTPPWVDARPALIRWVSYNVEDDKK